MFTIIVGVIIVCIIMYSWYMIETKNNEELIERIKRYGVKYEGLVNVIDYDYDKYVVFGDGIIYKVDKYTLGVYK